MTGSSCRVFTDMEGKCFSCIGLKSTPKDNRAAANCLFDIRRICRQRQNITAKLSRVVMNNCPRESVEHGKIQRTESYSLAMTGCSSSLHVPSIHHINPSLRENLPQTHQCVSNRLYNKYKHILGIKWAI